MRSSRNGNFESYFENNFPSKQFCKSCNRLKEKSEFLGLPDGDRDTCADCRKKQERERDSKRLQDDLLPFYSKQFCKSCNRLKEKSEFLGLSDGDRDTCADCRKKQERERGFKRFQDDFLSRKLCRLCNCFKDKSEFSDFSASNQDTCKDCQRKQEKEREMQSILSLFQRQKCIRCKHKKSKQEFPDGLGICNDCLRLQRYAPPSEEALEKKYPYVLDRWDKSGTTTYRSSSNFHIIGDRITINVYNFYPNNNYQLNASGSADANMASKLRQCSGCSLFKAESEFPFSGAEFCNNCSLRNRYRY